MRHFHAAFLICTSIHRVPSPCSNRLYIFRAWKPALALCTHPSHFDGPSPKESLQLNSTAFQLLLFCSICFVFLHDTNTCALRIHSALAAHFHRLKAININQADMFQHRNIPINRSLNSRSLILFLLKLSLKIIPALQPERITCSYLNSMPKSIRSIVLLRVNFISTFQIK